MSTQFRFVFIFVIISQLLYSEIDTLDQSKTALTYEATGRLGDCLITYLTSHWIAEQHNIPLLYVPFKYSEYFMLHEKEKFLRSEWEPQFLRKNFIKNVSEIGEATGGTLLFINYFKKDLPRISYQVYWQSQKFRKKMKEFLQPRLPVKVLTPPKDRLTVLAHVRNGGGYDSRRIQLRYPNKFPPNEFYIKAIEKISEKFNHPEMYVFIITDHTDPKSLAGEYKTALSHLTNIEFDYRDVGGPTTNVMEDFFSIPLFDCLIRGNSSFSIAASLLANFKAEATCKCHSEEDEIILDKIILK